MWRIRSTTTASDSTNGPSNPTWRTTLQRGIAVHSGVACSSRIQTSTSDHAASSTTWLDLLRGADLAALADNEDVRSFIRGREREHKRAQARLTNKRLLQAWLGSSGSRPLVYRWTQMRPIIHDIHDGLERTDA